MKQIPFTKEYDIVCDLNNGNELVKGIRFKLSFDLVNPRGIKSIIIGDHSHFEKITRLYFSARAKQDFVTVLSATESIEEIKFDLIGIGTMPIYQSFRNAVSTYEQIPVEIDNLSIKWENRETVDQKISVYFAGPENFWLHLNNYQIDTRTNKKVYKNPSFSIPNFDGKIMLENKSITDFANIRDNYTELITSKNALVFIPEKDLSLVALKKAVFSALEIFEIQFSMLQRKRVQWYKYHISSKSYSQILITNTNYEDFERIHVSNFLIDYPRSLDFVKNTHKSFYNLSKNGFDLMSPVNYYLSSFDISYIDASYAMLFFALEKLIHESITNHDSYQEKIIKNKETLNELRKELNQAIGKIVTDNELQHLISEKIKELNRPSFRRKLKAVLAYYNVDWKDLYDSRNELRFISIRNQLFHSNKNLNFSEVDNELMKLRSIFERIVLKLISWDNSPQYVSKRINNDE